MGNTTAEISKFIKVSTNHCGYAVLLQKGKKFFPLVFGDFSRPLWTSTLFEYEMRSPLVTSSESAAAATLTKLKLEQRN